MNILVVIVNYGTARLVADCLRSLVEQRSRPIVLRVVIVNNASDDDSVQYLGALINEHRWDSWVSLLQLDRNHGFSYGNNAAIRPALEQARPPDYVMLLNPDTVTRRGAITSLIEFMHEHPKAGIAGSRLEDPDTTPQISAFRFHSVPSEFQGSLNLGIVTRLMRRWVVAPPVRNESHTCDWVAGAAMMVRREVFEAIGLFDDGYFLYFDEVDFCLRARRAGWSCWYAPASRVIHLVGQATHISDSRLKTGRRPPYWFTSRRRYFLKHFGRCRALGADLAHVTGHGFWRIHRFVQRKADNSPPKFMRDLLCHSVVFKGFRV